MRTERGFSVYGALLALGLVGLALVVGVRYVEEWSFARRHVSAAADLAVLARAARAHAAGRLDAMRAATGTLGLREVLVNTLEAEGWLRAGFPRTNDLGQGYRVFHRRVGTDGLDVLVSTVTPTGLEVGYRAEIGYEGAREVFLGAVTPLDPQALRGPAIDAPVAAYQAAFGEPSLGEMAAITHLTGRSVYGSELHRVAVPGRPEANVMETDLGLSGNDIVGVNRLESVEVEVAEELRVLGGLEVAQALTVGQRLTVTGESTFGGALEAGEGRFDRVLASDSAEVVQELRAARLEVAGEASAGTVRATAAVSAPAVSADNVQASTVLAERLRSDDVVVREVRARLVRGNQVRGNTAVFTTVYTGGCSGC